MRTGLLLASLSGLAFAAVASGQGIGVLASGLEIPVNEYTTGDQKSVSVANVGPNCGFVAVWSSEGEDGSDTAVVGRLFDVDGNAIGGDFVVNVATAGAQGQPAVGSNAAGQFVVTWTDGTPGDPTTYEVRARRFDASGAPQGGEILVNAFTTGQQSGSSVAVDTAGNFVVVWASDGQDGGGLGVFGRRFDSSGNPLAGDFQVNEFTTGDQSQPRIAMSPAGDFLVVWQGGPDADAGAVMARRYDSGGSAIGGELRVNTTETGAQHEPDVLSERVRGLDRGSRRPRHHGRLPRSSAPSSLLPDQLGASPADGGVSGEDVQPPGVLRRTGPRWGGGPEWAGSRRGARTRRGNAPIRRRGRRGAVAASMY
jgi:hypothetical protein